MDAFYDIYDCSSPVKPEVEYFTDFCDTSSGNPAVGTHPYVRIESVSNKGSLADASHLRFHAILGKNGVMVKKLNSTRKGFRLRKMRYEEGSLVLSSLFRVKRFEIARIKSCSIVGGKLVLEMSEGLVLTIKMNRITDTLAVKNVLSCHMC